MVGTVQSADVPVASPVVTFIGFDGLCPYIAVIVPLLD
jgi:hypothetical protein